jgi:wobble nucleotide-excising tRNase
MAEKRASGSRGGRGASTTKSTGRVKKTSSARKTAPKSATRRTSTSRTVAAKRAPRKTASKPARKPARKPAAKARVARAQRPSDAAQARARLKQLSKDIDQVGRAAKKAVAEVEREYGKVIKDLRKRWTAAEKQLGKAVARKGGKTGVRSGIESKAKDLEKEIRSALRRVRR